MKQIRFLPDDPTYCAAGPRLQCRASVDGFHSWTHYGYHRQRECWELRLRSLDLARRTGDANALTTAMFNIMAAGAPLHLTPIEYRLLAHLIANAGKVLTHRQLLRDVWGPSQVENNPSLRVFMTHLRQKIERDPSQPVHLLTEIGVGYRFVL